MLFVVLGWIPPLPFLLELNSDCVGCHSMCGLIYFVVTRQFVYYFQGSQKSLISISLLMLITFFVLFFFLFFLLFKIQPEDIDLLVATVEDSAGITVVPAFSGLLAPHWRPDARAAITGLTLHSSKVSPSPTSSKYHALCIKTFRAFSFSFSFLFFVLIMFC